MLPLREKITIIKSLLKVANYDGNSETFELTLVDGKMYNFKVGIKELKNIPVTPKERDILKEPPLRQNLLLAYQIQDALAQEKAEDLKQISNWINLTHQRLNQILSLLMLCPKIQEEILLQDNKLIASIPEYKLRSIFDELNWEKQCAQWQALKDTSLKST